MGIDFNPRTPCGVRLGASLTFNGSAQISIHAPLAGCDPPSAFEVVEVRISIHAPLAGCDDADDGYFSDTVEISIHAPLAGCDGHLRPVRASVDHFNPRTPCGVRPRRTSTPCGVSRFQSTHPLRGATLDDSHYNSTSAFQSTHPLRGATYAYYANGNSKVISIHAPLAGCDWQTVSTHRTNGISIHAPLAGCDSHPSPQAHPPLNFNPRTPCGVRLAAETRTGIRVSISIHAPLAGCDIHGRRRRVRGVQFQSTHPLRGATLHRRGSTLADVHFNPRTPCGVRRALLSRIIGARRFQSTHPLRGATLDRSEWEDELNISIHAPLAGCDDLQKLPRRIGIQFQSTHPLRGATFFSFRQISR